MIQPRQTEYDIISFGLQTLSMSAQIFRLESDSSLYNLEYEIVCLDLILKFIFYLKIFCRYEDDRILN